MHRSIYLSLALVAARLLAADGDGQDLRLIPFPKAVDRRSGGFALTGPLRLEVPGGLSKTLGSLLNEELERAGLKSAPVKGTESGGFRFRLAADGAAGDVPALPPGDSPESYTLEVRPGEAVCVATTASGLVHGLQTLRQLIRANRQGDRVPCLRVRDWPSLRWRCFQDDLTRGPSSKLETLKFEASLASYLKLNLMTYYMESQYAFKKHPKIGPPDGSLTPEDLSALVAHARSLHMDILGNQQSFGHFGNILKHPDYASLRETADVLTPVRDETYQLLDDLYSEVCPLLPFPWFNVCCDETWGLGTGPARELAATIGVGGVYVRHIRRVHDLLRDRYGKRMMMWGDIILQHPDHLDQVPKETILLTWGYDARASFEDQIVPFAKSGYEFFVCPGVNNWSRILPDFGVAVTNIRHFVRDGVKHGALGMLNTDWEDDGEAINAVKWHADAWAAECAWTGATTPVATFNRRVGAVLFGEAGDHFGRAVELLERTHRLPAMKGMFNARFWERDFVPKTKPAAVQSAAAELLAIVRPAIEHLRACRREARCHSEVLDAFLFGARRMERIGQRMLDGLEAAQRYEAAHAAAAGAEALAPIEQLIRSNRDAHERLGREFAALWLAESKPYALDWTLRRYTNRVAEYDALLGRLAAAADGARSGRPLPAPEIIGLALPRRPTRCLQPDRTPKAPLAPELSWADPAATHRLGLTIQAGGQDRFHLPVEVLLSLPSELAGKPVRAFAVNAESSARRELLAQLEPAGEAGNSRLSFIVDGRLGREETALVHVYLGATASASSLPGAVRTRPEAGGGHWIENDRVRAFLGAEGAHIYRWEVKSAADRDLTMPGGSGWAGFGDIASHRQSPYRIECTARGPAVVEFRCLDPAGHEKIVRFFGGASWIEVFLGEPTPLYWDFDDPKNFAADGPTPGTWLFSNGQSGPVGREADGVPAQVNAAGTRWGIKFNAGKLALGLITPGADTTHLVAPGAGAGGVGIESSPPAQHFVTFAGLLDGTPTETMSRLECTLDLRRPVAIQIHPIQTLGTTQSGGAPAAALTSEWAMIEVAMDEVFYDPQVMMLRFREWLKTPEGGVWFAWAADAARVGVAAARDANGARPATRLGN
ncbi:MAG TPA: beta-N-acetylhexosaminidase [Verrucomicrobiota bacterium]|nr:beta-N-acetylhexosaminidase [Verrucomicrobiota bacterium]HNU50069.1 beta-N-acetylhexosaminidase [Verrucomicrobiota bacterium]